MRCSACDTENPTAARFCNGCGARLEAACPQCGQLNPPGSRFCNACGQGLAAPAPPTPAAYTPKHLAEKILTSLGALEGERKQVTVLFADLKGSMELLADRDPEDARRLLDPVLERMMEAVHRYEGTVNQVMGDGIMALFGAPLAHEDHALRACYAALRMQEAVRRHAEEARRAHGVNVQIRVGLNSGQVVVRTIGSDLHMDYTAVGQTTHLAARMEQLASPGSILLTPSTLQLVEGFVAIKSLGPVPVKGLADPVEVYEVTGTGPARTRLQAAARRGLTRFVGREAELEQLRHAQQLAGNGHGQVAAIVGEAGVGKSRLVYEFIHSHRLQGWLVLEAPSVSYGKATTYFPLIELLRGYFGIEPRDDGLNMRRKVTGKLLSLDRALEPTLPVFLSLLDLPVDDPEWARLDPPRRRRQTLEALKRLPLQESQVQPVLLVVEDLHWIDGETQAWLELLVESLPTSRLLLLVNYRPEYGHGWGSKTYYQQLRLDSLPPASAGELLAALLGAGPGLEDLERLLIQRTQGNPFFLEESVRELVETGALTGERGAYTLAEPTQSLQLPSTAQAIVAARIDRLAPEDKRLLQAAAVVGKDVPFAILAAITGQKQGAASSAYTGKGVGALLAAPGSPTVDDVLRSGLARLQAAELLYEARLFPELEYTFKHALTHEVAYGGLLRERRSALHAGILEAMEQVYADRLDEQVERLAYHALRGGAQEKAVDYLRQAGRKAAARSAPLDARAWLEEALGVLESASGGPESQSKLEQGIDIRLELRPALTQLGEIRRGLERLREAEALAIRLNDDRRRGRVCALMTNIHSLIGELTDALATGTRALEIAERLGDLRLRIPTTTYLEQAHHFKGEYERVVELAANNLAALPADSVYEYFGMPAPASVYDRVWLVRSLAELGRFAEAAEHKAEAIRLAEPTQNAFTVGQAYLAAGTLQLLQGDWAKARSLIECGIAAVRTGNVVLLLPTAVASSAWVLAEIGDASEALTRLRQGEQLVDRQAKGWVGQTGWAYRALGRACLLLNQLEKARSLADRAVESAPQHPGFAAHALHLLGDIATHPDRFDAESGEAHYRQALALAEPRGMRPLIAHCHLGLGKLFGQLGRADEARTELSIATTMYREMDMGFWLERAEDESAQIE